MAGLKEDAREVIKTIKDRFSADENAKEIKRIFKETVSGVLTVECTSRGTMSAAKGTIDFSRGDVLCTSLCCVSTACEVLGIIWIWCPGVPAKTCTLAALKFVSSFSGKFRDYKC